MPTKEELESSALFERYADRKRAAFVADYQLEDKVALVWQVWPTATVRIDTSDLQVVGALVDGSKKKMEEAWWRGFKGSLASRVFEGVASFRKEDLDGVVTEIHDDGHFVAGLWRFPEQGQVTGIGSFYDHGFVDALEVASAVLNAGGYSESVTATCTLLHADKTALLLNAQHRVKTRPMRKSFHWPFAHVNPGKSEEVGTIMARQFMGIYGRKPTS